jgi:hypothetical protein
MSDDAVDLWNEVNQLYGNGKPQGIILVIKKYYERIRQECQKELDTLWHLQQEIKSYENCRGCRGGAGCPPHTCMFGGR